MVQWTELLRCHPWALPGDAPSFAETTVSPDRFSGMLLGAAIGVAFRATSERLDCYAEIFIARV